MKRRLFFSIPLTHDVRDQLVKFVEHAKFDNVRWLSPENWHVTLLFMGDVQDTLIPEILEKIESVLSLYKPISLKFKEIVYAPSTNNALMIWAKYEKNEKYEALTNANSITQK